MTMDEKTRRNIRRSNRNNTKMDNSIITSTNQDNDETTQTSQTCGKTSWLSRQMSAAYDDHAIIMNSLRRELEDAKMKEKALLEEHAIRYKKLNMLADKNKSSITLNTTATTEDADSVDSSSTGNDTSSSILSNSPFDEEEEMPMDEMAHNMGSRSLSRSQSQGSSSRSINDGGISSSANSIQSQSTSDYHLQALEEFKIQSDREMTMLRKESEEKIKVIEIALQEKTNEIDRLLSENIKKKSSNSKSTPRSLRLRTSATERKKRQEETAEHPEVEKKNVISTKTVKTVMTTHNNKHKDNITIKSSNDNASSERTESKLNAKSNVSKAWQHRRQRRRRSRIIKDKSSEPSSSTITNMKTTMDDSTIGIGNESDNTLHTDGDVASRRRSFRRRFNSHSFRWQQNKQKQEKVPHDEPAPAQEESSPKATSPPPPPPPPPKPYISSPESTSSHSTKSSSSSSDSAASSSSLQCRSATKESMTEVMERLYRNIETEILNENKDTISNATLLHNDEERSFVEKIKFVFRRAQQKQRDVQTNLEIKVEGMKDELNIANERKMKLTLSVEKLTKESNELRKEVIKMSQSKDGEEQMKMIEKAGLYDKLKDQLLKATMELKETKKQRDAHDNNNDASNSTESEKVQVLTNDVEKYKAQVNAAKGVIKDVLANTKSLHIKERKLEETIVELKAELAKKNSVVPEPEREIGRVKSQALKFEGGGKGTKSKIGAPESSNSDKLQEEKKQVMRSNVGNQLSLLNQLSNCTNHSDRQRIILQMKDTINSSLEELDSIMTMTSPKSVISKKPNTDNPPPPPQVQTLIPPPQIRRGHRLGNITHNNPSVGPSNTMAMTTTQDNMNIPPEMTRLMNANAASLVASDDQNIPIGYVSDSDSSLDDDDDSSVQLGINPRTLQI